MNAAAQLIVARRPPRLTSALLLVPSAALASCAPAAEVGPPADSPRPTATAGSSSAAPVASQAPLGLETKGEVTCLMWHVCGCNVGCAGVRAARSDLREGMRVTVVSGVEAGKQASVVSTQATDGSKVLALDHQGNGPDTPHPCQNERPSPELLGFACATKDSGPVPVSACASGCGGP